MSGRGFGSAAGFVPSSDKPILHRYGHLPVSDALRCPTSSSVGTDPDQVARFILDVTDLDDPPLHLPLGESAFEHILAAENRRLTELTDWEQVSRSVG